jgi:phage terminase large subunit-like protein
MATLAPAKTLGPAVAEFFAANLRHTKGPTAGEPFELEPWQQADIDLIYELNDDGSRRWSKVLYGVPRGNGKSPIAAGVALLELARREDSPDVFCAAGSREQARIVQGFAKDFVETGPLVDFMKPLRNAITYDAVRGSLRTLSADGHLAHGLSISAAVRDEIHAWTSEKQIELYLALETAAHKRPDSFLLDITTAGFDRESLLGELVDLFMLRGEIEHDEDGFRLIARIPESGMIMIWRGAPDDADVADPEVWRRANPASWIRDEALARQASSVPRDVFRRLHLNQWTESESGIVDGATWDALGTVGEIPAGAEVFAGVDIGERRDHSAITLVHRLDDGRLACASQVFEPRDDRDTLLPTVEAALRDIADRFDLRAVGYDPWQFRRSAEMLKSEGMPVAAFPQNDTHMVPASASLHDALNAGQIVPAGEQKELRAHMLAAEVHSTARGTWRLGKPRGRSGSEKTRRKVDAAIALVIALGTMEQSASGPSVYESRGLRTL